MKQQGIKKGKERNMRTKGKKREHTPMEKPKPHKENHKKPHKNNKKPLMNNKKKTQNPKPYILVTEAELKLE